MSGIRQQALVDARKLVRTFAAAPDGRRRAQAVMSELRHAEGWSPAQALQIAEVEAWLQTHPRVTDLEMRLRTLLTELGALG